MARSFLLLSLFLVFSSSSHSVNETLVSVEGGVGFDNRMFKILESIFVSVGSLETKMTSVDTRLSALETRMSALETRMSALETAISSYVVTPATAAMLEKCAPSTSLFMLAHNNTVFYGFGQCYAIPLLIDFLEMFGTDSALKFLTAAHCFMNSERALLWHAATIYDGSILHQCTLLAHLNKEPHNIDLAIVSCAVTTSAVASRRQGLPLCRYANVCLTLPWTPASSPDGLF